MTETGAKPDAGAFSAKETKEERSSNETYSCDITDGHAGARASLSGRDDHSVSDRHLLQHMGQFPLGHSESPEILREDSVSIHPAAYTL